MTNAEYLIKNGIKFADTYAVWQGRNSRTNICDFKIVTTQKIDLGAIGTDGRDGTNYALKKWLDMKHEEPILDDAEMTNEEWAEKNHIYFKDVSIGVRHDKWLILIRGEIVDRIAITNDVPSEFAALVKWLNKEHEEPPILDDVERKYLKAVIRPWRGNARKIEYIMKREEIATGRIIIRTYYGDMEFPSFDAGTMYRGMENGREYSLEELGL